MFRISFNSKPAVTAANLPTASSFRASFKSKHAVIAADLAAASAGTTWLVKLVCSRVVFEELDGTEIPGSEGRITRNIRNAILSPPHREGHR